MSSPASTFTSVDVTVVAEPTVAVSASFTLIAIPFAEMPAEVSAFSARVSVVSTTSFPPKIWTSSPTLIAISVLVRRVPSFANTSTTPLFRTRVFAADTSRVSPTFTVASADVVVTRPPAVSAVSSALCASKVVVVAVSDVPENTSVAAAESSDSEPVETATDVDELTSTLALVIPTAPPAETLRPASTLMSTLSDDTVPAPLVRKSKSPSPRTRTSLAFTVRSSPTDTVASSVAAIMRVCTSTSKVPVVASFSCGTRKRSRSSANTVALPPVARSKEAALDTSNAPTSAPLGNWSPTVRLVSRPMRTVPS